MSSYSGNVLQMMSQGRDKLKTSPWSIQAIGEPKPAEVKFRDVPFYNILGELMSPKSMLAQGSNKLQEAQFLFTLTPTQATEIAMNRDIQPNCKLDFLYQIQLRFCPLPDECTEDQTDEFPPGICVHVNGKMLTLPNPLPIKEANAVPKRPPKQMNITSLCKLSPIHRNKLTIKWDATDEKKWAVGVWLVQKRSVTQLVELIEKKGVQPPEVTRKIVEEKLADDGTGIATDSLKATVECPLGKMRMSYPSRASTCDHIQCFDAMLFIQMNEKRAQWKCPVCATTALYENLFVDGYFLEIIESKKLPEDENQILLKPGGIWEPHIQETEEEKRAKELAKQKENDAECIDIDDDSDDDGDYSPKSPPPFFTAPIAAANAECVDLD